MDEGKKLSWGEFLSDIRLVITSPAQRFRLIHERGALWGSLLLIIAPAYFSFTFVGGIYFDRDPFPGYSFILPAVIAAALQLLQIYLIHFFSRLFQGRGRYSAATGKFRELVGVYGYATLPAILALILATAIFLLIPQQIVLLFRNFRVVGISLMLALGLAIFIWNLILLVLAMRPVYAIRDLKIISSFLLGYVSMAILGLGRMLVVVPAYVDYVYLQPILSPKIIGVFIEDPAGSLNRETAMAVYVDKLSYRFKAPKRFELVAFSTANGEQGEQERETARMVRVGKSSSSSVPTRLNERDTMVGRIVGLPGDAVEIVSGKLSINSQLWAEPYIAPEFQSSASLPMRNLESSQFLILPENRLLLDSGSADFLVERQRILGRCIVKRWPIGWWLYRPTVFLQAYPVE